MGSLVGLKPFDSERASVLGKRPKKRLPTIKVFGAVAKRATPESLDELAEAFWRVLKNDEHKHWPFVLECALRLDPVQRAVERMAKEKVQAGLPTNLPGIELRVNVDGARTCEVLDVTSSESAQHKSSYQNPDTQPVAAQDISASAGDNASELAALRAQVAALQGALAGVSEQLARLAAVKG